MPGSCATIETVARYYIENFGCRATQADGAAIERQLAERGLQPGSALAAQVVVLNTCTVTAAADQDARAAVRRIHRQNPDAKILVTGCYAQRAPAELAALPGVSWVVGNSHKHALAEVIVPQHQTFVPLHRLGPAPAQQASHRYEDSVHVGDIFAHTELLAAPVFGAGEERTRPNLKVQDGCDNRCSFCVIPYVRGQSRSMPPARVVAEVQVLVAAGYREVVISGINLGRWGRDLPAAGRPSSAVSEGKQLLFLDLVRQILAETSLEKLRISSVEPMDWSDALIQLVASSPRIARHAHVPMQSGSDAVLRRMHRKYRPWHYRAKIEKIRAAMPEAAIGADVMVGFPGETDAEFEETRRMVEELPFTYLHVFTYSARPGTPAAAMPKQVPIQLARDRNRVLRELAVEKKLAFMRSFIGKPVEAITLHTGGEDYTDALTDNYLKLRLVGKHPANQWLRPAVSNVLDGTLYAPLPRS